jgi:hypothetical protein
MLTGCPETDDTIKWREGLPPALLVDLNIEGRRRRVEIKDVD